MTILPLYTHIVVPQLKYVYLRFDHAGNLIIKSPKISQSQIEKILIKKAKWITESREKLYKKRGKPLEFAEGDTIYFLGQAYPVFYQQTDVNKTSLHFDEQKGFFVTYGVAESGLLKDKVEQFYKQKAQELLPAVVERYAATTQLFPSKITFRKAKSRWGSCNTHNAISLNYMMMKLPLSSIEYIILHELAHIKHKNHKQEFWQLVAAYMPEYRDCQNELKNYL